jgi:hypothetical protein
MTAGLRHRRGRRSSTVAAAFAAALLLAACTTASPAGVSGPAPSPHAGLPSSQVTALNAMSTLRSAFNHDLGHPRLVLIFSPT